MSNFSRQDRRKNKGRAKLGNRRGGFISLIVEPYRQIKLSAMILGLNLLFGIALGFAVYFYIADIHGAVSGFCQLNAVESDETWAKFLKPILVILSIVLVFFVLSFVIIIVYTHQIYGPLVSIHRYLDNVAMAKKTQPLSIRSSDQLVHLSEKLAVLGSYLLSLPDFKGFAMQDSSDTSDKEKNKDDQNENKDENEDESKDK